MLPELQQLQSVLKTLHCDSEIQKLAEILEGVMPDFDWLQQGSIFQKMLTNDPAVYHDFIEANSDVLSQFDVIKYLGHGAVGDVWLLENNKVLKIFNQFLQVFEKTDREKYEDIEEQAHQELGTKSLPMIYESGDFVIPESLENYRHKTNRNMEGIVDLAYTVMEAVQSYDKVIKQYLKENADRFLPEYDDEGEIMNENKIHMPIEQKEVSPTFQNLIEYLGEDYGPGLEDYLIRQLNVIIYDLISLSEEIITENQEKVQLGIKEKFNQNAWIQETADNVFSDSNYDFFSQKLQEMLGLPPTWEKELVSAVYQQVFRGRFDLHAKNFGFRNNHIVFFDG